jgi:hypothetical protein
MQIKRSLITTKNGKQVNIPIDFLRALEMEEETEIFIDIEKVHGINCLILTNQRFND